MTTSEVKKAKILIVDDEGTNIIALAQILRPNYDVIVAIDGNAAVEATQKHLPDLILLDVLMPDMSGFDVLSILKNSETTKNIPVIFITGLCTAEDEEKGLSLGAADYITKPFHNSIVKARVRTQLALTEYVRTIEQLCMIDTLTDLTNRRGLDDYINREWGRARREKTPLGILMIDIDNFKKYNDTYGHQQGDILLRKLADTLRQSLQREVDLPARWGGEEFAVVLPKTDLNGALIVAEQIRKNIERMLIPCADGTEASVTVSIGVNSKIPDASDSIADFIVIADEALYKAKTTNKNRVCSI